MKPPCGSAPDGMPARIVSAICFGRPVFPILHMKNHASLLPVDRFTYDREPWPMRGVSGTLPDRRLPWQSGPDDLPKLGHDPERSTVSVDWCSFVENIFRSCYSKKQGRGISTFFSQFSTDRFVVRMPGGRPFRLRDRNSTAFVHMFSTDVSTRFAHI